MDLTLTSERFVPTLKRRKSVAEITSQKWNMRRSFLVRHRPSSMQKSFERVLPKTDTDIALYLRRICSEKSRLQESENEGLLGIEFGGPGYLFLLGLPEGMMQKSLGVTIVEDDKNLYEKADGKSFFQSENGFSSEHEVWFADFMDSATYKKLAEWRGDKKIDVIFERLLGGFDVNPQRFSLLKSTFARWYDLLAVGGVMFLQVPPWAEAAVEKWSRQIQIQHDQTLEISQAPSSIGDGTSYQYPGRESVLCVRKLLGAPEQLPPLIS